MIKVLTRHPKKYLEQGLIHCGAFSVKAILSAYGKDVKDDPRDYHSNFLAKYIATSPTGPTPSSWVRVLKSYGVPAELGDAKKLSDEQRIELLKRQLDTDNPIMLRIGNGYSKKGKYHPLAAKFISHWITLWGYNDDQKIFYVYDSYIPTERHDKNIPIGNTTRTFAQVMKDWNMGFPPRWRYIFIKVG